MRHTFDPRVKVLNVTDYMWQVLQQHPPLSTGKSLSKCLEVMSVAARYVNNQHTFLIFFSALQQVLLYREPLIPAWSAGSVVSHVGVEVLQNIARKGRPVFKTWESGGQDVLEGSGSCAGGRPVSVNSEPGG